MNNFQQLSLPVALDDQATFDNFYAPNGTPQHMATFLLKDDGRRFAYLSGGSGSGLSHLLQASCQTSALGHNLGAIYLPLKELCDYPPEQVFEGLEVAPIVCIDDLQLVAHLEEWQVPLFNLFNRCRDSGCRLIISAHSSPDQLGLKLMDLLSRLQSGVSLHLPAYKDQDQRRLIQYRANSRGLYLSDEVANFLLNRLPRSSHAMMEALEALDKASLQEQRRLTLPFVKVVLNL
ncbi:MAG: DnaA regulatory inactivator Hda [Proteobacteria bacterium]|jgi:DnaA-homolog protein|uniref:Uncharacterized protein n=1 Tax=SAR92 bacterium BACL26 MAG-121220-bin70 TaxID=1655626 RepID=A0A0R2UBI4_9GAMM|nr:MAG: hypothetical protein ABS24_10640 [SAR92 bacterium BACL26 MAG-121220-bin70]MDA0795712.1 DnaA regulatory inactivator Hda [Pseudomonadota bacterium]MDA1352038.1 DnaA regulatory inactivator Hda [Pseudomonadota bacterium]